MRTIASWLRNSHVKSSISLPPNEVLRKKNKTPQLYTGIWCLGPMPNEPPAARSLSWYIPVTKCKCQEKKTKPTSDPKIFG